MRAEIFEATISTTPTTVELPEVCPGCGTVFVDEDSGEMTNLRAIEVITREVEIFDGNSEEYTGSDRDTVVLSYSCGECNRALT